MKEDKPQAPSPQPHRWQYGSANSAPAPASGRRRRLFRLSLLLMALIGTFLAWLLIFKPYHDPALTTIAITQYTDPRWPPDAQAEQDGRALYDIFQKEKTEKEQDLFNTQIKPLFVGELKDLATRAPKDRPVVIHLSSLACTNHQGEVCILPADARPEDPKTWVPLTDVLKWVGACPAPHKLLILDLMRPVADSRLGILTNDVAERVRATLETKKDLPFFVLCACSPGQVCLVDEELGQSVFGYHLGQGLRGAADGYNAQGKTDGRVSIAELAAYVTAQVDAWSVRRGRRQTPYLWSGQAKDFVLMTSKAAASRAEADTSTGKRDYPAALAAGWQQWEDWRRERVGQIAPWVLRRLAGKLLNVEQRWRSGLRVSDEELPAELARLKEQVRQAREMARPRHQRSLTLEAAQRNIEPKKELVDKLKELWKEWATEPGAAPADKEKEPAKAKAPPSGPSAEFKKKLDKELSKIRDPFELALAVWDVAAADDTESRPGERAAVLYGWYRTYAPATARPYVETLFLQRLAALKPTEANLSPTLARNALLMVRAGETVPSDPRVFPWIRSALASAQARRVEAEQLLFAADADVRAKAEPAVLDALHRFQNIDALIPDLEDAFKTREEALAFLPAYAACLRNRLEFAPDRQRLRLWSEAVDAVLELDKSLTPSAAGGAGGEADLLRLKDQLPRLTAQLRDRLKGLRPTLVLSRLRPWFTDRWANVNELDALLQLPWFAVVDDVTPKKEGEPTPPFTRVTLWRKRQETARTLLDEGAKQTPKLGGQSLPGPGPLNSDAAIRQERERALARAQVALTLLKLGGISGVDKLQQDWDHLQPNPSTAGLQALARSLFTAWNKTAPEQLKKLWESRDDTAAARLARVLPAVYQKWPWNAADVRTNPEYRLWLQENQEVWKWLAEDCRLKSQKMERAERRFYEDAAREYQRVLP